jgi:superfamily II DNA or RNA helicase
MIKYKIKKATISNKIYFNVDDIVDSDLDTFRYVLFSYRVGDNIYSTLEYNKETGECAVPSGSWHKLDIETIIDNRYTETKQLWDFNGSLRPKQQEIVDKLLVDGKLYSGLIQAGCGFGKSYVGSYLVGTYKKPTLIICHTKLLAEQWLNLLRDTIDGTEIGFIGDGRESIKPITVGIYKSLISRLEKLDNRFELILVDEAHLCVAEVFSKVVNGINAKVKIALTATPWRKDGLHIALPDYFGPNKLVAKDEDKLIPTVEILKTAIPFNIINPTRDWTKQLTKLASNKSYLQFIANKAIEKVAVGRCILILGERIEMLKELQKLIPRSILLVGETKNRDHILENAGKLYDVILSTRIFDEGISCHRLDTLMLTCPGNNPAKLEQRVGRILRTHPDKKFPLIVDIWLAGHIVMGQQNSRKEWYLRQNYDILT